MSFDLSAIVGSIGDDVIAAAGEPLGLDRELSLRAARALGAHWSKGHEEAVRAASEETGVAQDVLNAIVAKLADHVKDQALGAAQEKIGEAVEAAGAQAAAALAASPAGDVAKQAGGLFGRLFGKKSA